MSTASPLPSGVTPPYAAISDNDKSGLIAILTGFALGLTLLSAGLRFYPRHHIYMYRCDDWTFHAATLIAIIQCSLVFEQIALGVGREVNNIDEPALEKILRLNLGSDLLYILILSLSKASCAFFLLWLTPYNAHRKCVWTLILFICIFVITSLFVEGFRCPLRLHNDFSPLKCINFFGRWVYIGIFDMLIEIALIATSIYLIWGRQMAVKHKLVVVGAFFSRAPNIALTIMRLVFLNDPITLRDSDYWAARVVCTTEFAIGYTITSCMIPYLGPFMQPYEREPDQRLSTDRSYSKHSRGSSSTGTGITAPLSEYHFTSVKSRELTVDEEIEREILSNKEAKKWKDTGTELGGGLVVTKTVDWSVIYDETAAKEKDEDKTEGAKELKDTHKRSVRQVDEDDIQPVAPSERESLDMGVGGRREDQ